MWLVNQKHTMPKTDILWIKLLLSTILILGLINSASGKSTIRPDYLLNSSETKIIFFNMYRMFGYWKIFFLFSIYSQRDGTFNFGRNYVHWLHDSFSWKFRIWLNGSDICYWEKHNYWSVFSIICSKTSNFY